VIVALALAAALALPAPSPMQPAARFSARVETIDLAQAATMIPSTWRAGCPVHLRDLRLLTVRHWGFDGRLHLGEIIVHGSVASDIVGVFRILFEHRFPMKRIVLEDRYENVPNGSTLANNTTGFDCRPVTGGTRWSRHAYGLAIDINPLQNPYVYEDGHVSDPRAARYLDRAQQLPGMIHEGDRVVRAFARIGWRWGGDFVSTPDYQHFDLDPASLAAPR
jgi:D-alanyl-D-alanine carboxypeptidase